MTRASDTLALEAQARYLQSRSREDFNALYFACRDLASDQLSYISTKTQYKFDKDKFQQVINDAVANLLEYFIKKLDYSVRYFKTRIHQELLRVLYTPYGRDASDRKWGQHHTQLTDEHHEIAAPVREERIDLSCALQDVLCDHDHGRRIVIDIYRARSYKRAILAIDQYVSRRWIYDHSAQLFRVYKMTRKRA